MQEAERAGLGTSTGAMPSQLPVAQAHDAAAPEARTAAAAVRGRMAACAHGEERARCALEAILEASSAECAHLYGVQAGKLIALSVCGEAEAPEVGVMLEQHLSLELREDAASAVTVISGARAPGGDPGPTLEREGRVYHALALHVRHEGEPAIVAMLALGFVDSQPMMPPAELLVAIARALLQGQDVDPLTCIASTTSG